MKLELSKEEIKCIIELMEYGITFLITHSYEDCSISDKSNKEKININKLEEKLKKAIL